MKPDKQRSTRLQMLQAKLDEAIPYDLRPLWREFLAALNEVTENDEPATLATAVNCSNEADTSSSSQAGSQGPSAG